MRAVASRTDATHRGQTYVLQVEKFEDAFGTDAVAVTFGGHTLAKRRVHQNVAFFSVMFDGAALVDRGTTEIKIGPIGSHANDAPFDRAPRQTHFVREVELAKSSLAIGVL
jgi:hypothetical protein